MIILSAYSKNMADQFNDFPVLAAMTFVTSVRSNLFVLSTKLLLWMFFTPSIRPCVCVWCISERHYITHFTFEWLKTNNTRISVYIRPGLKTRWCKFCNDFSCVCICIVVLRRKSFGGVVTPSRLVLSPYTIIKIGIIVNFVAALIGKQNTLVYICICARELFDKSSRCHGRCKPLSKMELTNTYLLYTCLCTLT